MARSFPPDVLVLDRDGLLHARFARGKANPRLVHSKAYRLPAETFATAAVTPRLEAPEGLVETLRRVRTESGRLDKVSVLLPDSWFRMNLLDLPSLPAKDNEALDSVRWSLKRTLPIPPEQLRVTYSVLSRSAKGARILALSAMESTLAAIETAFSKAGLDIVLIEPLGLNLWNTVTSREGETSTDRLFLYIRDDEFTTAVFRGAEPLFIRSRNLSSERSVEQEIRLSANYLRDSLAVDLFATCYLAGPSAGTLTEVLSSEFDTTVRPVLLRDYVEDVPASAGQEAELTACTGVFTG